MTIYQGDQYRIPIELKHEDGSALEAVELQDLEVFIGDIRHTLQGGGLAFEDGAFSFYLTQQESFRLRGSVKAQARVLLNSGDVVCADLGQIDVLDAISKVVL